MNRYTWKTCFSLFRTGLLVWLTCSFALPCSLHALEIEEIYKRSETIQDKEVLTLSIQDADIQAVLKALSRKSGLNIVVGPNVKGNVSVHLQDAPLQEVLDSVITLNGLSYNRKGDILFVTNDKVMSEKGLGGMEVRAFRLNYVDLEEVEQNVKDILSSSAMVTIYKPEKTLIVEDAPHYLDRLQKVLKKIDTPPRQVLIEAKILEIRLDDDTALGIDWEHAMNHSETNSKLLTKAFSERPESVGAQGLFFSTVDNDFSLFLDALQTRSDVNTLSTPKLIALHNKEAKIIVGGKLGYFVTTATESTVLQTVEFLEVGTQLVITPQIMDDGKIIMEIHPEVSDGTVTAGLPNETTTEVTTTLIANDGETIFLGGLIRDRKEDVREQIPLLGSIPILGALFGRTTHTTQKTEIIVLITPHILPNSHEERIARDPLKYENTRKKLVKERSLLEILPGLPFDKENLTP